MTTTHSIGVADLPAGAGVEDMLVLGMEGGATAHVQAMDSFPGGKPFYMANYSPSITPSLESATVTWWDVAAMKVPANTIILIDLCAVTNLTADETLFRIAARNMLAGNCAQAAPAAGGAPVVAAAAQFGSGLTNAAYSYKLAQFNALNNEGPLSTVSANVTPTANQGINITIPALGTAAVGYRIYRSLAGAAGGPWYWVTDIGGNVTYLDVIADSYLTGIRGSTQHPGTTWGAAYSNPTLGAPAEMVYENVGVALASAPANISYLSGRGIPSIVAFAPAVTVNTRVRIPLLNEARSWAIAGPNTFQIQTPAISDYGVLKMLGFDKAYATIGGQWVVWGYDVRMQTALESAAVAGRSVSRLVRPAVFYPGETFVGQVANTATAVAGIRKVEILGRMLAMPT